MLRPPAAQVQPGKEETPQQLALKVLRAISKSTNSALQLDDVPEEFLVGETVDLHRWTLVMTDKNMRQLSEPPARYAFVDCAQGELARFWHDFWTSRDSGRGVTSLNISGATQVSEYGLAVFARKHQHLQHLNLQGCRQIGDAGLREIGINCKSLMSLNLSGCNAVQGAGLIAIAECCPYLLKLDVSKCRSIENFGLTKLFFECKRLEELNLSHLPQIGDEEIRVLALNCPNIVSVDLKESILCSDQSVLRLTQNCPDLDFLDVTRSSMAFRISDVSLLSLSEKSKSLRTLRVKGCDQLSDVGLTWIAEGCKALEEFDLSGCTKISDAGLRSLGASCRALTSLDISDAVLCTDKGVAQISLGCPQLKSLTLHGLMYLSDSRLMVLKGQKPDPLQPVIGVQAVAAQSLKLENFDLSGCFRLNTTFAKSLSKMSSLRVVNFTGCNQSTPDAFAAVAKGCTLLEEVNLTSCGKAVSALSIQAFCESCPQLRVLILCRNDGVRGGVVVAIAKHCECLVKLDLSHCKGLTDMMLLPICEVDRVMRLRTLILNSLPLVTDTTLAWLASKTQDIMLLSLKGTAISAHAVQAVRDRFGNSDVMQTDAFVGFVPKFRIEDRQLMNKYFYAKQGWIKLQARQRSWLARQRVKGIAERRRRKKAVATLQSMCRVFVAFNRVFYKRQARDRLIRKVLLITSVFRIAKAKKVALRRRLYLYEMFKLRMCVKLQTRWRIYLAKCRRKVLWDARQEWLRRRHFGAAKMQSVGRVFLAKARIRRIKALRRGRALVEERKTTVIQRCWRGSRGRIKAQQRRVYLTWFFIRRAEAATQIQRKARVRFTNNIVKRRQAKKRLLQRSSVKIQSIMRGALARLHVAQMIAEDSEAQYDGAASIIQQHWKVKQARLLVRRMKAERAAQVVRWSIKAVIIQCCARQKIARTRLFQRRIDALDALRKRVGYELWAVCKIQAFYRGYRGRLYYDDQVRVRKGKWKELFDEEKQARFFYNKITGEIRWRMPQDLLDLIPRPCCDNCSFYEGAVECYVCNEVYCTQCFEQVHYGGRRKDHDFRSLYDFYGKRMDYGDGVFPSKWPGEVMQDEVQGWMLRVAPIRDPVAIYDDWEEYQEIEPSGAPGRSFYFNRKTFEASYDAPAAVTALTTLSQTMSMSYADAQAYQSLPYDTLQRTYPPPATERSGAALTYSAGMFAPPSQREPPLQIEPATGKKSKKSKKAKKKTEEEIAQEERFMFNTQGSRKPELKGRSNPLFATTAP